MTMGETVTGMRRDNAADDLDNDSTGRINDK